jgi:3D-(3,5/4)-trihydroxycyclohexane-1,2-dione acylhydrolase (decyclizing)
MKSERLTVSQAIVRFLAEQHVQRDDVVSPFFGGVVGIFGHGNLAGVGQALLQYRDRVRYYQARNEQAMVHMGTGYAKMRNRLGTLACTTSIGPGATNMVTGAATATVNRLPVLLLPGDIFSTRRAGPVLQQLESGWSQDISVNDSFKAVSRYWDRINRPEQLPSALLEAMRVLTSPAETGAVTLALPQDVQAEAHAFPAALFEPRVWNVPRNRPDEALLAQAVEALRAAQRPLIVAGGGVIYSEATEVLRRFAEQTGIPVAETQSGKGSLPYDHPLCLGALGVSGSAHANRFANEADVVLGIGTRYTDFTTASLTLFDPDARFVNVNVAEIDSYKHFAIALTGDAQVTIAALGEALGDWAVPEGHRQGATAAADQWRGEIDDTIRVASADGLPAQAEVIGIVNESSNPEDVVVCAAGSLPGDLHRLWKTRDPKGYHLEYGFSCMGYEVAGAIGAKLAAPDREVYSMVGDGSWLMLSSDLLTAIQEGIKVIVVLIDNHGFGSIGSLSEKSGSQGFGCRFKFRGDDGQLSGETLPVDLAANARSLGAEVLDVDNADGLREALTRARESNSSTVIYVEIDPAARFGGSGAWWDVPIAEVSELETTQAARAGYESDRDGQGAYLGGSDEALDALGRR